MQGVKAPGRPPSWASSARMMYTYKSRYTGMVHMRAYDIIRKKRDGGELSAAEIDFFINGVSKGSIPDYQASAFLMAVFMRGMSPDETVSLTRAMLGSGTRLDTSGIKGVKLDKHSTGGVGDKTSIILAPLAASMGVKVPMVSGRALGHTGGTLDKLESIAGLRTDLSPEESMENLRDPGLFITGQTGSLVPADRELYALRDVTATVESVPLIAASIMSKKLAEGIDGLVLDVKTGAGAFMKGLADARALARTMVDLGNSMGVRTVALVTDMDQPLGKTVGNSLEVKECISALSGKGAPDLMELTLTLNAWMLNLNDSISEEVEPKPLSGFAMKNYQHEAMEYIEKGDALRKLAEFIDAQGGDPEVAFKPNLLPSARGTAQIKSETTGHIRKLNAEAVGTASMLLGAGREKAGDSIDPAAGIILNKKVGDPVQEGEPLAMFHFNEDRHLKDAEEAFRSGLETGGYETARRPIVLEVIS